MFLTGRTESGAEDWQCPECGRRMLMRWPPSFESLVLEEGDPSALHAGAKGGALMGEVDVASEPSAHVPSEPEVPSGPEVPDGLEVPDEEQEWLRRNGIEWDGLAS